MIDAPANLLTVWARLVAASLVSTGVRDVVVSPGSRSTPFVLALRERAELRLTSVIDERSAAFVALGMARSSGRAAAVLATSGTAPAHWLPAVIEASLAHLPLVLLSANRPVALAQTGAAQTIDQTKLFGSYVRFFADLGDPGPDEAALSGLARTIGQAVAIANGHPSGPVHLDLHADKPLEPVEPRSVEELALTARARAVAARGVTQVSGGSTGADDAFATVLAAALGRARRPLVLAGPRRTSGDEALLLEACAGARLPVAPEATSQLRFAGVRSLALEATELTFSSARFATEHAPDCLLQIGALPTAPTLERAWSHVPRFVLDAGGVHDPIGGALAISLGPATATLLTALERARPQTDEAWLSSLLRGESCAWAEVERALASPRTEGAIVRSALGAAPRATLVIGNSLPIRTLDRFVPGGGARRVVLCQRGANGIDGLVSGAVGAAIAGDETVLAVVGDVSFLHDLNALATARTLARALVVVIVDNGGGRIFEGLPIARDPALEGAMALFTTPHGVDLAAASRAFGVACTETDTARDTARAVANAITRPQVTIVRARVADGDAARTFPALIAAFERAFYGAPT